MSQKQKFLCFNLGIEEFAIPLLSVREVIGVPETTPIPQMPSYFVGIMNLRGSIISIMDLRGKMGIKPSPMDETSVVILDMGGFYMGVVVDRVNSVVQIPADAISEKPQMEASKIHQAIVGVWRNEAKLILLLDTAKALSIEDKVIGSKVAAA